MKSLMSDLLGDVSKESNRYVTNSSVKTLLTSVSKAARDVYVSNMEDSVALHEKLTDLLLEASQSMRRITNLDLTLELEPLRMSRADHRADHRVEVQIPKMGQTPGVLYARLSPKKMEELLNSEVVDETVGRVDLDGLVVYGFYTRVQFKIVLGLDIFRPDFLTDDEIVAIMFHELGHILDFLATMGDVTRIAAVTGYVKKVLKSNSEIERKFQIVRMLDPKTADTLEDPGSLTDEEILTVVSMSGLASSIATRNSAAYDNSVAEFVADSFTTRHGLAYPAATAMRKLQQQRNVLLRPEEYRPQWMGAITVIGDLMMASKIGKDLAEGVVTSLLWIAIMPLLGTFGSMLIGNRVQATPTARLKKMRETLVGSLKHPDLTDVERRLILSDLKSLDGEMKSLERYVQSVSDWFSSLISDILMSPTKRDYHAKMVLESLDNNRLFEIAAKLKR